MLVVAASIALATGCAPPDPGAEEPAATTTTSGSSEPGPTAPVDPSALRCPVTEDEARRSLRAGATALGEPTRPRVDATWARQLVADRHPALRIDDALAGRTVDDPTNPALRLLDPSLPPSSYEAPDGPLGSLLADVNLVFRRPTPEVVMAIDAFTARTDLRGYALTHQWLSLIWAEELGVELPLEVRGRSSAIEARVRAEVGTGHEPQDLWAERTALLAWFGTGPVDGPEREQWLCRAVRTQGPDGRWGPDGEYEQEYEGETFTVGAEWEHVTALMTLLLGGLLAPE